MDEQEILKRLRIGDMVSYRTDVGVICVAVRDNIETGRIMSVDQSRARTLSIPCVPKETPSAEGRRMQLPGNGGYGEHAGSGSRPYKRRPVFE
jgi:hypothetical protein